MALCTTPIAYINRLTAKKREREIQAHKKIQESINIPFQKPIVRNREKESKNKKKKW
jgi:hypothetical protein